MAGKAWAADSLFVQVFRSVLQLERLLSHVERLPSQANRSESHLSNLALHAGNPPALEACAAPTHSNVAHNTKSVRLIFLTILSLSEFKRLPNAGNLALPAPGLSRRDHRRVNHMENPVRGRIVTANGQRSPYHAVHHIHR